MSEECCYPGGLFYFFSLFLQVCVLGEDNISLGLVHPVGYSLSTIFFADGWDLHVDIGRVDTLLILSGT